MLNANFPSHSLITLTEAAYDQMVRPHQCSDLVKAPYLSACSGIRPAKPQIASAASTFCHSAGCWCSA